MTELTTETAAPVEAAPEVEEKTRGTGGPSSPLAQLAMLQRTAGNRALVARLGRLGGGTALPTVQRVPPKPSGGPDDDAGSKPGQPLVVKPGAPGDPDGPTPAPEPKPAVAPGGVTPGPGGPPGPATATGGPATTPTTPTPGAARPGPGGAVSDRPGGTGTGGAGPAGTGPAGAGPAGAGPAGAGPAGTRPAGPGTAGTAGAGPGGKGPGGTGPAGTGPGDKDPGGATTAAAPAVPATPAGMSDADFQSMMLNLARVSAEVSRGAGGLAGGAVAPLVIGVFGGLVADSINMYQDFHQMPGGADDDPLADVLVGTRDVVAIVNNALGTIISGTEELQDEATASVVGVELDAITIPVNEGATTAKVAMDGAQIALDILVNVEARVDKADAPKGSAQAAAWDGLINNYDVNIATDIVSTIMDFIDEITAGIANMEPLKAFAETLKNLGPFGKAAIGFINNIIGIYGSNVLPTAPVTAPAATAPAAASPVPVARLALDPSASGLGGAATRAGASMALDELDQLQLLHTAATQFMTDGFAQAQQRLVEMNTLSAQFNGGRGIFETLRDGITQAIAELHNKVGEAQSMIEAGGTVRDKSAELKSGISSVDGSIRGLHIPDLHVPHVPEDQTGSTVTNAAADLADRALQIALSSARGSLERAKTPALTGLQDALGKADRAALYGQTLQDVASGLVASLNGHIASLGNSVAHITDLRSAADAGLSQLSGALGLDPPLSVADAQAAWAEVGTLIATGRGALQAFLARAPAGAGGGAGDSGDAAGAAAAPPPGDDAEL